MRALVGTRKGLLVLEKTGAHWKIKKTHFEGVKASYAVFDPKHQVVWAGINHGHWGAKLHQSSNRGHTFRELGAPSFPQGHSDTFKDFWSFATDSQGRVWLGAEPAALFYSDDCGETWSLCEGFDSVPKRDQWFGAGTDDHCLHSIVVDPEDDNHLIVGVSVAGVLVSRDRGKSWHYSNKGLTANYLPDQDAEVGQDPHLVVQAPSNPEVLWQQNHCGIFRSDDGGDTWRDFSKGRGLKSAFGFAIAVDESDEDVAYTVPATSDENRIPVRKRLLVQKTINGGRSWRAIRKGLPDRTCYDLVYRNALALKDKTLMFGSTTGNLYVSASAGESWRKLPEHLPPIYSVRLF